jgi:hypothetical protein
MSLSEKFIVNMRTIPKFLFDRIQVVKSVLDLQFSHSDRIVTPVTALARDRRDAIGIC